MPIQNNALEWVDGTYMQMTGAVIANPSTLTFQVQGGGLQVGDCLIIAFAYTSNQRFPNTTIDDPGWIDPVEPQSGGSPDALPNTSPTPTAATIINMGVLIKQATASDLTYPTYTLTTTASGWVPNGVTGVRVPVVRGMDWTHPEPFDGDREARSPGGTVFSFDGYFQSLAENSIPSGLMSGDKFFAFACAPNGTLLTGAALTALGDVPGYDSSGAPPPLAVAKYGDVSGSPLTDIRFGHTGVTGYGSIGYGVAFRNVIDTCVAIEWVPTSSAVSARLRHRRGPIPPTPTVSDPVLRLETGFTSKAQDLVVDDLAVFPMFTRSTGAQNVVVPAGWELLDSIGPTSVRGLNLFLYYKRITEQDIDAGLAATYYEWEFDQWAVPGGVAYGGLMLQSSVFRGVDWDAARPVLGVAKEAAYGNLDGLATGCLFESVTDFGGEWNPGDWLVIVAGRDRDNDPDPTVPGGATDLNTAAFEDYAPQDKMGVPSSVGVRSLEGFMENGNASHVGGIDVNRQTVTAGFQINTGFNTLVYSEIVAGVILIRTCGDTPGWVVGRLPISRAGGLY